MPVDSEPFTGCKLQYCSEFKKSNFMKAIFFKEECVLLITWVECQLIDGKLVDVFCKRELSPGTHLKTEIINTAFIIKKNLDKRDVFLIA